MPADVRPHLLPTDEALRRELLRITDWFTDELFALPATDAVTVRFPVSRLVVDPERFPEDGQEVMASRGLGVIYTRTWDGETLREAPESGERDRLLQRFYHPHHAALTGAVAAALRDRAHCLLIDCHSFPSRPLPVEIDRSPDRPDICLGTDVFHTPPALVNCARELFEQAGFSVAIDRPFSGVLVPAAHWRRDVSVLAVMIEVNRRLYMNEDSGERSATFSGVARRVQSILSELIRFAAGLGAHSR